jgi:hypothetical protein
MITPAVIWYSVAFLQSIQSFELVAEKLSYKAISMIRITLNILISLLMLMNISIAGELEEYRNAEITVRYEAPLKSAAQRIAAEYSKNRNEIEVKLGWRYWANRLSY